MVFLLCDRADGLSLFYLTSGVSPAPPATTDSTVRSRWATRDAAARLTVRRHLPTTERRGHRAGVAARLVTEGAEPGGAGTGGAEPGGAESGGAETWGAEPGGAATGGAESARVASRGASSRREVLSSQELRQWFARRWGRATGAGGTTATTGSSGTGATGSAGPGAAGAIGVGAAGGVDAGGSADAGTSEGAGAGAAGAGGATGAGAPAGSPGAVPAGSGGAPRPRPYFVLLLEQVLGLPPSPGPAPPFECPQPVQSQSLLQPVSPLPAASPYTGPTGGLVERRAYSSRPASPARPACTSRRTSRPRPPAVPCTHQMALRPSTAPLLVPLPSPITSSLPAFPDPESDSLRAASPTVARFLATVVTDPSLASTAASALVAELVDFAASCRLDYAASLVAESASVCPPSVGGECALSTDVLEDRQEEFQCFAAALPHLELRWLTYVLTDLGEQPRSPPVLYVDNKAMLALCREHRLEHRTKHIALRYFLARELQQRGQQRLAYVASEANTADIFTKALAPGYHQRFCTLLDCVVFLLVGDASAFRVWGSRAFVRDLSADKLSPRAVPCVFLGFPPDAPGWQFYHPTSRRILSSQDVTFNESVPYYRLFPYRTASLPPPPLFLAPGPPPVDPLPPQGPAPSGVSQVDAVEPVEVAVDSGAATGAEPSGAGSGGAGSGGAKTEGAEPGGAGTGGAEPGGAESGGAETWGAEPGGAATGGTEPGGAEPGVTEPGGAEPGGAESARVASRGASSRREVLSPQELRQWFARRWGRATGAGGTTATTGSGGTVAAGSAGPGAAGATEVGAAGGVGAGGSADAGTSEGAGAGAAGAGGATGAGALAGSPGAVPAGSGGAPRPRPYFVPLLEQVLGLPPSPGPAPPFECPQPVQSQSLLQPVSPLPAPSPYTGPTGGLAERRAPASRPASPARPACTSRRTSRPRPPAVPGTHQMALRPSTAPLRVPLPSPPASSLPAFPDPESDSLRAASPTVARFLATVVTDPSLASTAASALVSELVDFAASCRLDYAASLVAESASVCPPSVGGECALSTDVLEDRQEVFQCFAAALPHLVSTMLAPEGDPDAPDIPTPRSYAEAIEGPYSSQWQAAMDAEMASWKSTGTYVDEVPPPGANIPVVHPLGRVEDTSVPGAQVLYVDNKAMLALFREHRLEHRTKHIALRYFLARELQQRGQLRLAYMASEANTADIFTKALAPGDHQRFCTLLGLVPTWPHLLTS
ncbi:unnamed protein product [Closterium sp. NIES-54]